MASDTPARPANQQQQSLPFPLQSNEEVTIFVRRHWIFLWPRLIWRVLVAIVPPLVVAWLISQVSDLDEMVANVFWIAAAIWAVFWLIKAFLGWYQYNNDIWVITNQRIVDSNRPHPLSHKLATADLVNVQDMSVERSGILQTTLNYGDIICDTASKSSDFVLSGIPDPASVQLLVDKERDRERMRTR